MFTQEELIYMIYSLGEAERNSLLASRMYAQRFPERRHPNAAAFANLKERFERTGCVGYEKKERTRSVTHEENQVLVAAAVVQDPHLSSREMSRELEISQTSVSRILRKNKFHPYHVQLVQELDHADFNNRLQFCEWALHKLQERNDFFDHVLFTDEATFLKNGFVTRRNCHYYNTENPHWIRPLDRQHRWSLDVWGGIFGRHVIGPHGWKFERQ